MYPVVTYSTSNFDPPNATDVIAGTGSLISCSIDPDLYVTDKLDHALVV